MTLKDTLDIFEDQEHQLFQVRSKSSIMTIEFAGQEEKDIFVECVEYLKSNQFATAEQLIDRLVKRYDRDKVCFVINELRDHGIVEERILQSRFHDKLKEQINFWNQISSHTPSKETYDIQEKIQNTQLGLIGTGRLIALLKNKAELSGFKKVRQYSIEPNMQLNRVIQEQDILIFAADDWNPALLDEFNTRALELEKPWVLIRGMDGGSASVGPLFAGRGTGCYHCLSSRLKSHVEHLPHFKAYEHYLRANKSAAKSEGGPMVAYDIMASIAMLEVVKYLTGWAVPVIYGAYLTLDVFEYELQHHPFLKSPVCHVCKPDTDFNPAPWLEPISITNSIQ